MGTSINTNAGGGKLFKSNREEFNSIMESLNIEYYYYNEDWDCPNIKLEDVKRMIKSPLLKDELLKEQLQEIINNNDDLSLVF